MCKGFRSYNSDKNFSTSVVVAGVSPVESVIISEITSSKTTLLSGHILFGWLGPGSSLSLVESLNLLISSISISLAVVLMILPEKKNL